MLILGPKVALAKLRVGSSTELLCCVGLDHHTQKIVLRTQRTMLYVPLFAPAQNPPATLPGANTGVLLFCLFCRPWQRQKKEAPTEKPLAFGVKLNHN